jgi:FMN phosphatase YigB (HAD superfamily)
MKPVLFLDFDRTLFDTDQLYDWLGEDRFERILALTGGNITPPDFAEYLYPDTISFLKKARRSHRLVLLTFAKNTKLQRMKIRGSGIVPLLDDVIITIGSDDGSTGKGEAIQEYFLKTADSGWEHTFVDDDTRNLYEVKMRNKDMRVIRIDRVSSPEEEANKPLLTPDAVVTNLSELEELL